MKKGGRKVAASGLCGLDDQLQQLAIAPSATINPSESTPGDVLQGVSNRLSDLSSFEATVLSYYPKKLVLELIEATGVNHFGL